MTLLLDLSIQFARRKHSIHLVLSRLRSLYQIELDFRDLLGMASHPRFCYCYSSAQHHLTALTCTSLRQFTETWSYSRRVASMAAGLSLLPFPT